MEIQIGNKIISNTGKPYFIADIAANHDGSLERAFKLIELAKEAGADAAKFQNFHASSIVSRSGFDSMEKMTHQASWKKSVYDVYDDATLPLEWTEKLKKKCDEVDIEYMTSPYDKKSVDQVEAYVNAYKIALEIFSGQICCHILHKRRNQLSWRQGRHLFRMYKEHTRLYNSMKTELY